MNRRKFLKMLGAVAAVPIALRLSSDLPELVAPEIDDSVIASMDFGDADYYAVCYWIHTDGTLKMRGITQQEFFRPA